jgi:hypothetical protein
MSTPSNFWITGFQSAFDVIAAGVAGGDESALQADNQSAKIIVISSGMIAPG